MKATKSDLTAERLRELLHYDPQTGFFTWKIPLPTASVGARAEFWEAKLNHYRVCVDGARMAAHRLAWLYTSGSLPNVEIRHLNGDTLDNRVTNLATSDQYRKALRLRPLTLPLLKQAVHYDANTGLFTRLVDRTGRKCNRVGQPITTSGGHGYTKVVVYDVQYRAHRLAWFYTYGVWPDTDLDHINRDRSDNRIANLRPASRSENNQNTRVPANNTSGFKGVTWDAKNGKWMAQLAVDYKNIKLGRFLDINDAIAARKAAEAKYHPFAAKETSHA